MKIELVRKVNGQDAVCLNPYSNGMKIEPSSRVWLRASMTSLNPYSNGMKIERFSKAQTNEDAKCLNPYSNGMKIEPFNLSAFEGR